MIQSRSVDRSGGSWASAAEPAVTVTCVHAERCGGCPLIALPYPAQLARKLERVVTALRSYPELAEVPVLPVASAEPITGYRGRAKLMVAPPARVGLYQGPLHEVLDIPDCRVLTPALSRVANAIRDLLRAPPREAGPALIAHSPTSGALCAVDLREARATGTVRALVTLVVARERAVGKDELRAAAAAILAVAPEVVGVAVSFRAENAIQVLGSVPELVLGEARAPDEIAGIPHKASFGSFVQAHREQAAHLHQHIIDALSDSLGALEGRRVLELYAGSGAIGFALARAGATVTLGEEQPAAAQAARELAHESALHNVAVIEGDAGEIANQLQARTFDAIVVDPPRRGLSPRTRLAIASLAPRALVYVSCQPETFARDSAHLARLGLQSAQIQPFDMIPLSEEVECVALFARGAVPPPRVLREHGPLLAIDKPAHESTTPQGERAGSLLERVRRLPDARQAVPIHRLDADTSGVCLFAREPSGVAYFAKLLASGQKQYLALVRGVAPKKGVVNRPLRDAGRILPARTRYRRLALCGGHSLLALYPDQGRKHQLRRHLASIGHPVVGDRRYGHAATNRHFEERFGLDRAFLHCERIVLPEREAIDMRSALPGELAAVLDRLEPGNPFSRGSAGFEPGAR